MEQYLMKQKELVTQKRSVHMIQKQLKQNEEQILNVNLRKQSGDGMMVGLQMQ